MGGSKGRGLTQSVANCAWVTGVESERVSGSVVLGAVGDGGALSVASGKGFRGDWRAVEVDRRAAGNRASGRLKSTFI